MAETITVSDIKAEVNTSLSDAFIAGLIALVDGADACLDGSVTDPDLQKSIKIAGVAFLIEQQQRGGVSSEKSPSGASRNYKDSSGLDSPWGRMLQMIDTSGCVLGVVSASGPTPYLRAI